jgi:PPOX class probable F420-dependent enzyme
VAAPDKHVQTRLKRELIIWIATVGRDGHPHVVPVWFWWDGKFVVIYAVPGQKVRDIQANPNVALHLNTDPVGDDVVRIDGTAKIDPKQPPAYQVPNYVRKYREQIKRLRLDAEGLLRPVPPRHSRHANPLSLR